MDNSESREIGAATRPTILACLCCVAAGIAMVLWGRWLPGTFDPVGAEAALAAWCGPNGVDHARGAEYLSLLSNRYPLIDAGTALVGGGLAALLLFFGLFFTQVDNTIWLRTPRGRAPFIAIGVGIIALHFTAEIVSLEQDLHRMMFPWCADSIGIAMVGIALIVAIATPVLILLGALVTLGFGTLPVPLTQWDPEKPGKSWALTVLCGVGLLVVALSLYAASSSGRFLHAPGDVAAAYLLLATRAALLGPPRPL